MASKKKDEAIYAHLPVTKKDLDTIRGHVGVAQQTTASNLDKAYAKSQRDTREIEFYIDHLKYLEGLAKKLDRPLLADHSQDAEPDDEEDEEP